MGGTCSSGCPAPPSLPWLARAGWKAWDIIIWPLTARQLKRSGFRRTGWMTWEAGPDA